MIQTESLLPIGTSKDASTDVDCSAVNPALDYGNVSLSGDACAYKNFTVVDNGPRAMFAGVARSDAGAAIRVKVVQEKMFAAGVFTLDDWVGFSVDGGPQVALPAKGVEPVYVTAYFPDLPAGPHHVFISAFQGLYDGGAPQGTVCL